ncbi:ankyrin repeat domain-containing protein [Mangrovimonas xylaniphaga]|uniref:ankyrin repeat domain-containing protein n=1 Tax=Mangrovimonas xylaniphaga TaxID=1645915 RepID=UPI0006B45D17|nr:ankyrin repeat domain-containing protein [Mangrovimonas xylaniphaga]
MNSCFKSCILGAMLLMGIQSFSQDNAFLSRDFWKSQPDVSLVKAKIAEGNDPAQANANNFDGIVYAILEDAPFTTITYLVEQEGNGVNKLTHDGRTYIFWAAYKGNTEVMEYLLQHGAKTDIKDDKGNTILNFAASSGQKNIEVYDFCLANGANLKKDVTPNGANALLLVAPNDQDFQLVEYFQKKGLDINSVDRDGNGIFNYVARIGNLEALEALQSRGIKGNNQAFMFAAYGTRGKTNGIEVYKFLEEQGLNPNVINREGQTPLHILASRSKDEELIRYLLEKGLDVNIGDHNGNTPFMNAAYRNNLDMVQLLSKNLKDINHANKKGQTALFYAVDGNSVEVVNFMMKRGAKIDVVDNEGNSLVYALVNSYSTRNPKEFSEKLRSLEKHGLLLGQTQKNGNTWYHMAVEKGNLDLLKMASEMKIDVNAKNGEGNTALHLAAMKASDDGIMKFLVAQGASKTLMTEFEETAYDLAQENELLKSNNISIEFLK